MDLEQFRRIQSRRKFFRDCAGGIGTIALAQMLEQDARAAAIEQNPLAPRKPHFPAKAKNIIFMFMEGGPSQIDLFDPKPELQKWHGKPLPAELTKDLRLAFTKPNAAVLGSPRVFTPQGKSGTEFSDFIPNIGSCADDLCLVRSMYTDAFNHHPGQLLLFGGSIQVGRPTMGAWVPLRPRQRIAEPAGIRRPQLRRRHQRRKLQLVERLSPLDLSGRGIPQFGRPGALSFEPSGVTREMQRASLDVLKDLNEEHYAQTGDMEIASRISFLRARFPHANVRARSARFFQGEPETLAMYGVNEEPTKQFATNCLLARRMVERGVRFVMLNHASWDDHTDLNRKLKTHCDMADKPTAALIRDLKQRGLLEDTLVVWGGEFGRTPMCEIRNPRDANNAGRDHHPLAYSLFLAGGGIKGGTVVGKTGRTLHERDRGQGPRPRPASHPVALSRPRSHPPHLPPHGPRLPPHGRGRQRSKEDAGVANVGQALSPAN
jgi:hypothetical protein